MYRRVCGSLVLSLVFALAGCFKSEPSQSAPARAAAKDPEAARKLVAEGAVVLDVRTPEEFSGDHVPNAVNIPVQELGARLAEVDTLVAADKTRPIVVYCRSGSRAAKAKTQLEAAGHSRVVNGGGLDDVR